MWPDLDPDSMAAYYLEQSMLSEEEEDRGTMCRYCKRGPYFWEKTDKGWRLTTERGLIHRCKAFSRSALLHL